MACFLTLVFPEPIVDHLAARIYDHSDVVKNMISNVAGFLDSLLFAVLELEALY